MSCSSRIAFENLETFGKDPKIRNSKNFQIC